MTEIFVKSEKCNCVPVDTQKKLAIVEGQTSVWVCMHTSTFELNREEHWRMK